MNIVVYDTATGQIKRTVCCPADHVAIQCQDGEEFYLNCPEGATHIVDGAHVTIAAPAPSPPTVEALLSDIRGKRDLLLTSCDWTQLSDAPLTAEKRGSWQSYRQALRDLPKACDPLNPVWPALPV